MSQQDIPALYRDHDQLLSESGFATGNTWYHGTASGLVESIKQNGLIRSGDKELNSAIKQTMATIGNSYKENKQPVFITQSKSLAYYWAEHKTRSRNIQLAEKNEGQETPVVVQIDMPEELRSEIKPDVGAAAFILTGNDAYMDFVNDLYTELKFDAPQIDPIKADRMEYQDKLGMVYINKDIPANNVSIVEKKA